MVTFCGQERCLVDANGRIKLGPRFLSDLRRTGGDIVLYCLPEGALGVYPASTWLQMRQREARPAVKAATSAEFRRQLRRFGAMSQAETLSNQGRFTVPPHFRSMLSLEPGQDVIMVGCEIGVEVWSAECWTEELKRLREQQ